MASKRITREDNWAKDEIESEKAGRKMQQDCSKIKLLEFKLDAAFWYRLFEQVNWRHSVGIRYSEYLRVWRDCWSYG